MGYTLQYGECEKTTTTSNIHTHTHDTQLPFIVVLLDVSRQPKSYRRYTQIMYISYSHTHSRTHRNHIKLPSHVWNVRRRRRRRWWWWRRHRKMFCTIIFTLRLRCSHHAMHCVYVCACSVCGSLVVRCTRQKRKTQANVNTEWTCVCVREGIQWVVYCGSFKMFSTVYLMALRNLMYVSKYHESNYYFLSTPIARQSTERNVCLALGA